ncbi:MAG: recombinase family protein [Saprospiraceae bacterium]
MQKRYTPYYRVSTKKQGQSGLGLKAQKDAVLRFVNFNEEILIGEFQEVESGKNNQRVELENAIEYSKRNDTTLLIAKLDRLSRNAAFIFKLRDEQVDFVCCDIPDANTLTIGIFATLAQHERELISSRTKAALAALKKQGKKLGSPQNLTDEARKKAWQANHQKAQRNENNRRASGYIKYLRDGNMTYQAITDRLNSEGFRTARSKYFTPTAVRRLYLKTYS